MKPNSLFKGKHKRKALFVIAPVVMCAIILCILLVSLNDRSAQAENTSESERVADSEIPGVVSDERGEEAGMEKLYNRINFENAPSKKTPLSEENLNKMDEAIDALDDRIISVNSFAISVGAEVDEIKKDEINIVSVLDWEKGTCITPKGAINNGEGIQERWGVAKVKLPKGTVVEYELYATENTSALAIGSDEESISSVQIGNALETVTTGSYTVMHDWETLYFMTDTNKLDTTKIVLTHPTGTPLKWTIDYISKDGEYAGDLSRLYAYSEPIKVPAMNKISASLQTPYGVAAISVCDSSGSIIRVVREGENVKKRLVYEYITNEDCYVRLCTRVNDDTAGDKDITLIKDVEIKIEPYTEKYRVPSFDVGNGHINSSDNTVRKDNVYMYTSAIRMYPGETIRFYSAGSEGIWALSQWDMVSGTQVFVKGLIKGNTRYRHCEYTNENDYPIYVRVSGKVVASNRSECVITPDEIRDIIIFHKDLYYEDVKNHPLYGKRITLIGDSLAYGQNIGPDGVWLHLLALKYNMVETNMGINGSPISNVDNNGMVNRYTDIPESDYIVLIGGSNDIRLGASIGSADSTDASTMSGALNVIIDGLRNKYPKAKLLFLTTMNRYQNELPVVNAMVEVCGLKSVPCFNNYTDLGLYFGNDEVSKWADAGIVLNEVYTKGTIDMTTADKHLSREAYQWILPKYEMLLSGL